MATAADHVLPLSVEYLYQYPVMAEPMAEGADQDSVTFNLPAVFTSDVGVPGTSYTRTEPDDADQAPRPLPFVAAMRKMYAVFPVRPVTVADVAVEPVLTVDDHVRPLSVEYEYEYEVIAEPLFAGAPHVSDACSAPAAAVTALGADANVNGVLEADAALYAPVPMAFTAATRNTYAVPLVRPVTVAEAVEEIASANVVHVEPLSSDHCTR